MSMTNLAGILSIENCGANPHHAMAVTGYTADYFQVKQGVWGRGMSECRSSVRLRGEMAEFGHFCLNLQVYFTSFLTLYEPRLRTHGALAGEITVMSSLTER